MSSFNKAILIGRLTADPELRQTANNLAVCTFRIAVNRHYKDSSGSIVADFLTIVAWRKAAEFICKYFRKGNAILVEGSIQTRDYVDKNGNNRVAVEILADRVGFVESKSSGSGSSAAPGPSDDDAPPPPDDREFVEVDPEGDLPF